MIPGQEKVAEAATALTAAYDRYDLDSYFKCLQVMMGTLLPVFPEMTNAVGLRKVLKESLQEFKQGAPLTGDAAQELLYILWEELDTPPRGSA